MHSWTKQALCTKETELKGVSCEMLSISRIRKYLVTFPFMIQACRLSAILLCIKQKRRKARPLPTEVLY